MFVCVARATLSSLGFSHQSLDPSISFWDAAVCQPHMTCRTPASRVSPAGCCFPPSCTKHCNRLFIFILFVRVGGAGNLLPTCVPAPLYNVHVSSLKISIFCVRPPIFRFHASRNSHATFLITPKHAAVRLIDCGLKLQPHVARLLLPLNRQHHSHSVVPYQTAWSGLPGMIWFYPGEKSEGTLPPRVPIPTQPHLLPQPNRTPPRRK